MQLHRLRAGPVSAIYSTYNTSKPTYFMKSMLCFKNVSVVIMIQSKFYEWCSFACCHTGQLWYKRLPPLWLHCNWSPSATWKWPNAKKCKPINNWISGGKLPTSLHLANISNKNKALCDIYILLNWLPPITAIFKWIGKVSMHWWACSLLISAPSPAEVGCKTHTSWLFRFQSLWRNNKMTTILQRFASR